MEEDEGGSRKTKGGKAVRGREVLEIVEIESVQHVDEVTYDLPLLCLSHRHHHWHTPHTKRV